ncbi:Two-component response regulator SSK1p [Gnomoniopsis smithogilvyi]|uniref:Two-component response regulator SSK1p n=1 Tax=Gnomoniopsis smithogilvyi TaxID=1191159 RepID=A0A9W8YK43_9PEZI|nr:Two-component response regulator SSK1p [Gnomoniopsis smithogilvyi]
MAELAAKIRAKFRRRHSAIPGIPSLLGSRTTSQQSSGSHGSSLFRPSSLSHSLFSSHDADGEAKSRRGSSRGSVLEPADEQLGDADADADANANANAKANGSLTKRALTLPHSADKPQGGEMPVVVAQTGNDALPHAPEQAPQPLNEAAQINDAAHGEMAPTDASLAPEQEENARNPSADLASPTSNVDDNNMLLQVHDDNGDDDDDDERPVSTAPIAAPAPASTAVALTDPPLPLTSVSSSAIPASLTPANSDMSGSGKDRQPSLRKLSIVDEQPSPDHLANDQQPQSHATLAPASNALDDSISPGTVAPPPPPTAPTNVNAAAPSISLPKRDDAHAKLRAAAPLTPKLGPPTPSRPRHIHLPPASFGGPNPNLSPGAVYSALSNTAPTSPLRQSTLAPPVRPAPIRRQSLLSNRQSTLIQTLLGRGNPAQPEDSNSLNADQLLPIDGNMVTRKIWVKRPGASATLVTINEDDLVDDVREMILRKYANSLGRQFDAPDLTLRIRPNGNQQERMLGPEEPMSRTLDAYFPSGQTIDDALIIDVPLRRSPRASPRVGPPHAPQIQYYVDDPRPPETANDYFGPGALSALPVTVTAPSGGSGHSHAISVLNTGQVPQIPSPGNRRARDYRERPERPRLGRQHTSSPTLINLASGATHQGSIAAAAVAPHDASQAAPQPAAVPTPPPAEPASAVPQAISTPPARVASPRPKKIKKKTEHPMLPKGMLNGSVPPINVLIVEDNIINLKLLEAFVKRLKVRWSTAMNGRDAVTKWRNGGFHLVLMDIQLPIMSGLDATREIRRLERVNSIGVFSSAASSAPEEVKGEPDEKDKLENKDLFKSPVIIVALTASSLQSDRHEALAAGCNDFLTKPVNFVWLERKVMEWGCMQALIDFDGWRKWKDFSSQQVDDRAKAAAALKAKSKKNRSSLTQAIAAGA